MAMTSLDVSQRGLSLKIGLHPAHFCRIVNGGSPMQQQTRLAIECVLRRHCKHVCFDYVGRLIKNAQKKEECLTNDEDW